LKNWILFFTAIVCLGACVTVGVLWFTLDNLVHLLLAFALPFSVVWFALEWACDKQGFKKLFGSLKKYRFLLTDLVSRELKTKYRRSALGVLWSVLNPLLMMLVLTAIFSNVFRFQIEDFPVYYLTGYLLFNFVSESTSFSMTSILGAAGLIKKVYIPKMVFPLEKCLFSLVNLMFSLIAAVIVFIIVGVTPSWTMLLFFVPIVYLFIFNFGFGLILATLNTFFRDVGYLYGVLLTVWMYLTPIIYPMEALPGWMQSIIRINPLYHYVEYFRAVTLYGTLPSLTDNLVCIAYAVVFLLIGVGVFHKSQNKFIFYV
jgi:ABC-2 type transport system permease protein